MELNAIAGRLTTRSRPRATALILGGLIAALTMAIAAPAQAHEPWVAKAWGLNAQGELGDGTFEGPEKCEGTEACSATPARVSGLSGVTAVSGGKEQSYALLEGGTVMAWGANGNGQLGNGTTAGSDVPVEVSGLKGVTALAAGANFGLALLQDGTVMAWGNNETGELGDGTTANKDTPVPVSGLSERALAISAGRVTSYALLKSGKVMAWGAGSVGQLGDGKIGNSAVPVEVSGLTGVTAISSTEETGLARLENGTLMSWGDGTIGQLGDGTSTNTDVPASVCAVGAKSPCSEASKQLKEVSAISGGGARSLHALALLENGSVVAWGENSYGQLGDATSTGPERCNEELTPCARTPVAVSGLTRVTELAGGGEHSLALVKGGLVMVWGKNNDGQLGLGTTTGPEPCPTVPPTACSATPLQVASLTLPDVKGIGAGRDHSLAFGPAAPTITGVSPNKPLKKGTTKVTITGSEFEEATEVKFGAAKATGVKVGANGTVIEAEAPAGKGTVDVTVTTPAGTSATSEADRFYYSSPTVKRVSPRKGPELGGTSVTITGINFAGVTGVKFGSSNATSVKVNSGTSITAVSPAHAGGVVYVTVSSSNGTSAISKKARFKYT
jgi:alpha-tubulin suppressor-like RCC1 family protein